MYSYSPPIPLVFNLSDKEGFLLREKAAEILETKLTKGAEHGSKDQQGFGILAEVVVREKLGIRAEAESLGHDILLPTGVKVDVKCRGGALPFKEIYIGLDTNPREAKHNFFARQIYDDKLDTDIYLMIHLETPAKASLPGTTRQKKWILYLCGWVSKERVKKEGVFLPRGSLTEQGKTWFTYRGQEIEFYNKNLNGLEQIRDLLKVEKSDVEKDEKRKGDLNLTSVDAIRIMYDLIGKGLLDKKIERITKKELGIDVPVSTILHKNQYLHFITWLVEKSIITKKDALKVQRVIKKEEYSGI